MEANAASIVAYRSSASAALMIVRLVSLLHGLGKIEENDNQTCAFKSARPLSLLRGERGCAFFLLNFVF